MIRVEKGDGPLILCLPRAGTEIHPSILPRLSATGRLQTDVSWRLETVLDLARELDATVVRSTVSHYVVDPDQDPSPFRATRATDTALCPVVTLDNKPIYKPDEQPGPTEIEQRLILFHSPFHDALCREIERLSARHGKLILLDCQSARSRIKGFCDRGLPIISLGTGGGNSCDPEIKSLLAGVLAETGGYSVGVDDVFKGGFITRSYGRPEAGLHALTMVVAQRAYLRHETPPFEPDKLRLGRLKTALRDALLRLGDWAAPGYTDSRQNALAAVTGGQDVTGLSAAARFRPPVHKSLSESLPNPVARPVRVEDLVTHPRPGSSKPGSITDTGLLPSHVLVAE